MKRRVEAGFTQGQAPGSRRFHRISPSEPSDRLCRQEQDGLPQLIRLLPARPTDRQSLFPDLCLGLARLLAKKLDWEGSSRIDKSRSGKQTALQW